MSNSCKVFLFNAPKWHCRIFFFMYILYQLLLVKARIGQPKPPSSKRRREHTTVSLSPSVSSRAQWLACGSLVGQETGEPVKQVLVLFQMGCGSTRLTRWRNTRTHAAEKYVETKPSLCAGVALCVPTERRGTLRATGGVTGRVIKWPCL